MRRLAFWIYCAVAAFTIVMVPLGLLGLADNGAVSGMLLLLLGFPWSFLFTRLLDSSFFIVNFALLAAALAVNAAILWLLQRRRGREVDVDEEFSEEEDV